MYLLLGEVRVADPYLVAGTTLLIPGLVNRGSNWYLNMYKNVISHILARVRIDVSMNYLINDNEFVILSNVFEIFVKLCSL